MKIPKKTTADVPPFVAKEYAKAPRPQAIAEATGDGYTMTEKMHKAARKKGQFGLPVSDKSPGMRMGRKG